MAKDVKIGIDLDTSKAIRSTKGLQQALEATEGSLDDTRTAGQRTADALSKMADDLDSDLDQARAAAERLGQALGDELRADLGNSGVEALVSDLRAAGLTFEQVEADADALAASIRKLNDVKVKATLDVDATGAEQAKAELQRVEDEAEELDRQKVDIDVEASGLDKLIENMEDLPGQFGDLAGQVKKLGSTAGVAAIAGGFLAAADHAADLAVSASDTAKLTGDSVDFTSRLQAIWQTTGGDVKDLQDVLLQMNGVLSTSPQIAEEIGVSLNDGKTVGERFLQVIEILNNEIDNTAERSRIASQIFGEEGVRQVNTLIGRYDDLGAAMEDLPEGLVFTEEEVAKAREMKAQISELQGELQSIVVEIGQNVVPMISSMAEAFGPALDAATSLGDTLSILGEQPERPFGAGMFDASALSQAQRMGTVLQDLGIVRKDNITAITDLSEAQANETDVLRAHLDTVTQQIGAHAQFVGGVQATIDKMLELGATTALVESLEQPIRDAAVALGEMKEEATAVESLGSKFDAAAEAANSLNTAMDELFGGQKSVHEATVAYEGAVDSLTATIKENKKTLDLSKLSGRENAEAIEQQGQAVLDLAAADLAQGKTQKEVVASTNLRVTAMREAAIAAGLEAGEVDALIATLGLTPENVETAIKLTGTDITKKELENHLGRMRGIPEDVRSLIQTFIDHGQFAKAETALATIERRRKTDVDAIPHVENAEVTFGATERKPRQTDIDAVPHTENAEAQFGDAARARTATITANADTGGAESALNDTARDRWSTIFQRVQQIPFVGALGHVGRHVEPGQAYTIGRAGAEETLVMDGPMGVSGHGRVFSNEDRKFDRTPARSHGGGGVNVTINGVDGSVVEARVAMAIQKAMRMADRR